MSLRRHYRLLATLAAMVAAALTTVLADGTIQPDGVLYDAALGARSLVSANDGLIEPVVVIGVDQRSLDSSELKALPRVLFAPYWARLIEGAIDAGAVAVGFDMLFAWSSTAVLAGYDQPFLMTLNSHRDKVVLGRSASLPPARPFFFAVGAGTDPNALGFVEVAPDSDGVLRQVSAWARTSDGPQPTIVTSVAAKAGLPPPPDIVRLAPARPLTDIPTYAMVDVLRCADADPQALEAAFAGRIVLVGTLLAEEDRKLAPDRFVRPSTSAPGLSSVEGCALIQQSAPRTGGTVPGVMIHAEALTALATGRLVSPVSVSTTAGVAAAGAGAGVIFGVTLAPLVAIAAAIVLTVLLFATSVWLLTQSLWMPIAVPILTVFVAVGVAYVVRYLIEDRRRRQIQAAFGHYLAPTVVDQLANAGATPELGGENNEVSIMFADLSGFTALSGKVAPDELMALTNRYLGYIAEAVETSGGYVDKFIGDCVMAIWGAPVKEANHAVHAVRAARTAIGEIIAAKQRDEARGEHGYAVKIGINSGTATVGNVGWTRRFNYTAVGEAVNLAARLESVPGDYDCRLVVGAQTRELADAAFIFCELDTIRVKGKAAPVAVFEPICPRGAMTDAISDYLKTYGEALAQYRAGDFAGAERLWSALDYTVVDGTEGGPPRVMARRAAEFNVTPPEYDWDGVWVKPTK